MALSPQFFSGVGEAMKDLLLANVCAAVGGVDINIFGVDLHPFWFLNDWATNLRNDANTAIHNSVTIASGINGSGNTDPAAVSGTVTGMKNTDKANSSAIASLTATNNQAETGGTSFGDNFSVDTTALGNLGPNWTEFAVGTVGSMIATGGQAQLTSGSSGGRCISIYTAATTLTDDQSVAVVLGDQSHADAHDVTVICRSSATADRFVYGNVYSGTAYLGFATLTGGALTPNDWIPVPLTGVVPGMTLELRAQGSTYRLYLAGTLIASHTDASNQHPVDSSHRFTGIGETFGSFNLHSFNASDLSSPPIVGTGWSIVRSATGSISIGSSASPAQMPAGTFDTDTVSNVTIENATDLGQGVVKCTKPGWYTISMRFSFTASGGSNDLMPVLYAGTNKTSLAPVQRGSDGTGNAQATQSTFVQFVPANSYVAAGLITTGGSSVQGWPDGSFTYFNGVLCSGPGQ
ncbi:hypothetical protein [Nocardia sp. NPDC046763]|uniref:hypothetical protein n=1 Tax=Nocardia sp. NPDC046763 TaxID=3155256 RepID=UPI0033C91FBB